ENGLAYVFDRLSAFEEWLNEDRVADPSRPRKSGSESDPAATDKPPALSKNKREQLEKEVSQLEQKIASTEAALAELELCFQNPATGTDWESTHKRYADLKLVLERLYEDLSSRWEMMG